MHGYFEEEQKAEKFLVVETRFNVIIGEMLWDPGDVDWERHSHMLASSTLVNGGDISDNAEFHCVTGAALYPLTFR